MTKTELIKKVKATGSHFFDRDTMSFFNSKLISVYGGSKGVYFVTSEKPRGERAAYTVRGFTVARGVDTVGEFMGYAKGADAQRAARALAGTPYGTKYRRASRSYRSHS